MKKSTSMDRVGRKFMSVLIFLSLVIGSVTAQEPEKNTSQSKGSIEEQFRYIVEKSGKYQEYKVVNEAQLKTLRSNVLDTLKKLRSNLKENNNIITAHQSNIDSVKAQLQNSNNRLEETFREKNSIRFLGMLMSKEAYSKTMWIIIILLTLVLAVFAILYKRSNSVTLQNKQDLEETRKEFDKFRKRALEREQELSRNHLAELNKYRKQSSGS